MDDVSGLSSRLRSIVDGDVLASAGDRALYSMDASNYRHVPDVVVRPRTTEALAAAVSTAAEFGASVVMRGGGTGIGGNSSGGNLLIDTSRYLNRILDLDPERRIAYVEPGLVLDDLQDAAAAHGLRFGPDPSTHGQCTIGGMLGNNACGSHSVAWGKTAENVEELDVLLDDGTPLTVGAMTPEQFAERAALPSREGVIFARLRTLVEDNLSPLRLDLSNFSRRVSGYSLEHLLPERQGQVARALVGSEGTCAVVSAARLRLVPLPAARVLAVIGYRDDVAAAEAAPELLAHRPLTIEGMSAGIVEIARRHGAKPPELPAGEAWLFVEMGGADLAEATARARALGGLVVVEPAAQRALWRVREEGAGLATRLPDGSEAWPGWEDSAVPPERLGAYLTDLRALLREHGLRGLPYGHFGEGCIHLRIDFDFDTGDGRARYRRFMQDAADCVAGYGGSLSGEHGDGQARAELLPRMYGERVMALFADFKEIWDPSGRLNPGILVKPRRIDADLRFTALPDQRPKTIMTYESDADDFRRAVRRCVGVGKCRSDRTGVMCPSYRVTRDEKDSTRGRARMLFEMLSGNVVEGGWRSPEVRDALDLCLSCKGCRADCPVEVDMARYKSEFLHHHYARRIRPASHYSMGFLPLWARVATRIPRAASALAGRSLSKRIAGIAPERSVPEFARESFTSWFRARPLRDSGRPVLLWPDTFTNFLAPEIGQAAVDVLEDAGFSVRVPSRPVCCGLTWITTGQLGTARRILGRSLRRLREFGNLPVVGLEPSCAAALRDDLPALIPDAAARSLAGRVSTLAGFLEREAPDWRAGRPEASAITQVHCHQHAVLGHDADERLLARSGVDNRTLDQGCCGLAGNFGFEREHYDLSIACAERGLAPEVRSAPESTLIIADGFSCRTQIEHTTGRRALHLAEVLRPRRG
ncbi:MAG TPA: FAD-binding and (Fe-S)-binding domain-containing protein [Mycobacteriales bacterium]|nr:FAD-binding and (Fe-S)-binding domain-containing protein [Mycobacteriales bacterium]